VFEIITCGSRSWHSSTVRFNGLTFTRVFTPVSLQPFDNLVVVVKVEGVMSSNNVSSLLNFAIGESDDGMGTSTIQ